MTHKRLMNAFGLATIASIASATTLLAADASKLPAPSKQAGVTFEKDIQPIFKANCYGCHGPNRQSHKIRLDSLDAVLQGGSDGKIVVPGKSAESDLALAVCWDTKPDHPMPPQPRPRRGGPGTNNAAGTPPAPAPAPAKPLTTEQVSLIRAWIDQGAK